MDYLIAHEGNIYPVEVKAGTIGKLKSLQIFLAEKKAPLGIKMSQEPLGIEKNILSIPFYLTSHITRLIESIKNNQ